MFLKQNAVTSTSWGTISDSTSHPLEAPMGDGTQVLDPEEIEPTLDRRVDME